MFQTSGILLRLALLLTLTSAACSTKLELLEPCTSESECASGLCAHGPTESQQTFCSQACSEGGCPDGLVCATSASGESVCMARCDGNAYDFACDDGVPVRCDQGGQAIDCTVCGCPDGNICGRDLATGTSTCQPPRAVGQACRDDFECASVHCGVLPGQTGSICFDAPGSTCTPATCGSCDLADGVPTCAQQCQSHAECGDERWRCYGENGGGPADFYCREYCDFKPCPEGFACRTVSDPDLLISSGFCFPG